MNSGIESNIESPRAVSLLKSGSLGADSVLVRRCISGRSSSGMPRMAMITRSGNSVATSAAKSISPFGAASSLAANSCARASRIACCRFTAAAVNQYCATARYFLWSGSSMWTSVRNTRP